MMKFAGIIAIIAIAMIGMIIPSAFAETYVFKNLEDVSIDIPSSFETVKDEWTGYVDNTYVVRASHPTQGTIEIYIFLDDGYDLLSQTDNDIKNAFQEKLANDCAGSSFASSSFTCTQYQIIDNFITHTVDGYGAISFVGEYVRTTEHGGYYNDGKSAKLKFNQMVTIIGVDGKMAIIDFHFPADKFSKYDALELAESLNLKNINKKSTTSSTTSFTSSSYDLYEDEYGLFSMNYPSGWHILHGDTSSVQFADSKYNWSNVISVFYFEDVYYNEYSDDEIKQDIQGFEEDVCYSSTYKNDGFICYDFQYHGSEKIKSNPLTFKTVISYVKEYSGGSDPQGIVGYVFDVVDNENSWNISSESMANGVSQSEGKEFESMMSDVMNSFTINQRTIGYTSLNNLPTLEYYYYVEDVPDWADSRMYNDAVDQAIQKISKENPWLSFREVSYEDSEIDISWIKEYGTGTLGEAHSTIGSVHIEMGDSQCGYWLPHSEDMLADTIAHELLHGVGFEHVNNPKSIMYYEASDAVYAFEENGVMQFEEYVYQFIPFCTIKNTTDYFVDISSDEYNEKFDVFFVKSESDADKYGSGDYFNKYPSCYEEDTTQFSKTCRNVSGYGGIVIGTDYISDGVIDLEVYISETRYDSPTDYSLEKVEGLEYVLGVNANFEADRQNYSKAITIYNKILESNPNDTFALNNLGTVYEDLGDSVKAMQYYEKTLRLNPTDEFALSNIGAVLHDQGKYKEAIEYYQKALDVNPESVFTLQMEREAKILLEESKQGGGCLIATATYGSEMATEVQQLRELRDNTLLNTESGTAFMSTFNDIYYSFSPIIADYERENPLFKEAVKLAITPMISSLSLMENANSESEVLSIGISIIVLNLGMYLGVPAIVIVGIRRKF